MARLPDGAVRTLEGPPTNIQITGMQTAARQLTDLIVEAAPGRPVSIVAGLAGAGRPNDRHRIAEILLDVLPSGSSVRVISDAELALHAAFGTDGSGFIVIAGTGSIVLCRSSDGSIHRAGGWGYLLGDEGGGYRIGVDGLGAVADAFDGGPVTGLRTALLEDWGIESAEGLIRTMYRDARKPADFAPVVLACAASGDAVAHAIIGRQADALARRFAWLSEQHAAIPTRTTLSGGLCESPLYRAVLERAIRAHVPRARFEDADRSPVEAALDAARVS
jgi:N-acetylglucosamine kinase-like BadF-type ATPase